MSTSPHTPPEGTPSRTADSDSDALRNAQAGHEQSSEQADPDPGADCGVSEEAAAQNSQSQVLGTLNGPERAAFEAIEHEVQQHLQHIAGSFESRRAELSAEWRRKVSADLMLASSPAWSKRQFEDHIPASILVLCAQMRAWPDITALHVLERDTARAHSKHRWQQGYDLRSLTREWGHLNTCLLAWLDSFWCVSSDANLHQALRVARSLVAESILGNSSESVSEYARLLQTEAVARARQMELAIEALREEERSRGQVLREAAHDLRGSLGIVSGSASIVDRTHMDQDDRAEVGRILRRGVHSLHEMMTDLIDLARLEAGEERVANRLFDVSQVLRELGATVQPLAQNKGLTLSIQGPQELRAWGDSVKVRRIAQNLLLNAIKYTTEGGISLSWSLHADDRWLLRIEDTGPGLDHSRTTPLVRALHEATNASREVEGRTEGEQNPLEASANATMNSIASHQQAVEADNSTVISAAPSIENTSAIGLPTTGLAGEGVGLSIVKRLCDLMGASIELDTRSGQGSAFRVLFVRTPAAAAPIQLASSGQLL